MNERLQAEASTPTQGDALLGIVGTPMESPDPADATLVVKTLARPAELDRLLRSIRRFYPRAAVLVADDAEKHDAAQAVCGSWGAEFLPLPHDVGLSAGRNALVDACRTPYLILLDDDFVFTARTDLDALLQWVRTKRFDIAGGMVLFNGQPNHFEGNMTLEGGTLKYTKISPPPKTPYKVDICLNFFAAEVEALQQVRWNPALKVCEHQAFFLDAKAAGLRVVYVPHVEIDHQRGNNKVYATYRMSRSTAFWNLFCSLYGVRQQVGTLS